MCPPECQRQRFVGRVVVDGATSPHPVRLEEIVARAEVGRPITVERHRFVEAARHQRLTAAEAMCEEIRAKQIVVIDATVELGVT